MFVNLCVRVVWSHQTIFYCAYHSWPNIISSSQCVCVFFVLPKHFIRIFFSHQIDSLALCLSLVTLISLSIWSLRNGKNYEVKIYKLRNLYRMHGCRMHMKRKEDFCFSHFAESGSLFFTRRSFFPFANSFVVFRFLLVFGLCAFFLRCAVFSLSCSLFAILSLIFLSFVYFAVSVLQAFETRKFVLIRFLSQSSFVDSSILSRFCSVSFICFCFI